MKGKERRGERKERRIREGKRWGEKKQESSRRLEE